LKSQRFSIGDFTDRIDIKTHAAKGSFFTPSTDEIAARAATLA
jgi:hypothetical protein